MVSPTYLYASYIFATAFSVNRMHIWFSRMTAISSIAILLVFLLYPIYLATRKKVLKSIVFIAIQIIVFVTFKAVLNAYDIDSEKINFLINEDRYVSLIKEATPFRPDKEVYIIKIEPRYMYCDRYLVHDKGNEFIDPKNDYFGIGRTYATTQEGKKIHAGRDDVRVRKYSNYMYLIDSCSSIVNSPE